MQHTDDEQFMNRMNALADRLIGRLVAISIVLILLEWVTR